MIKYTILLIYVCGIMKPCHGQIQPGSHKPVGDPKLERILSELPEGKDTLLFDYFQDGESDQEEIVLSDIKSALKEYPKLRDLPTREVAFDRCPPAEDSKKSIAESDLDKIYVFLSRQKYNSPEHQKVRKELTNAFMTINGIYWENAHGGTGFGHMYESIPVYVEEEVANYELSDEDDPDYMQEKIYYIKMLKAEMAAKEAVDFELTEKDKKESYAKVYKMIIQLEKEISSRFLLQAVRRFHFTKYE